jgi:hypothetical protein
VEHEHRVVVAHELAVPGHRDAQIRGAAASHMAFGSCVVAVDVAHDLAEHVDRVDEHRLEPAQGHDRREVLLDQLAALSLGHPSRLGVQRPEDVAGVVVDH